MVVTLQIISIVLAAINLVLLCRMKRIHTIIPIIIVFDFVMVVPILLELILGIPDIPYPTIALAMNDQKTSIIFCIFLIFAQLSFGYEITRLLSTQNVSSTNLNSNKSVYFNSLRYKNFLLVFSYIVPIVVIISILGSPDITYFLDIFSDPTRIYNQQIQTYIKYMGILNYALLLSVMVNKWYDNNGTLYGRIIRILYVLLMIIIIHKRTFMMIAIGTCLVIDIIKGKKIRGIFPWYLIYILFAAFYFVYYAYATGKAGYNDDWYYEANEYFFRSMHMRFAIFAALNPNEVHILDYPGQSILFDLFYFIPRSLWASKPWPYIYYFISGVMGYSSYEYVSWQMPPSYYPEFVSNFGILGIFISVIITVWISRFLDNRGIIVKLLGTSFVCLLEIYYYDNALKVLVIIIIFFYFLELKKGNTSLHYE